MYLFYDGDADWTPAQWNEIDVEIVPSVTMWGFSRNLIYGDGY